MIEYPDIRDNSETIPGVDYNYLKNHYESQTQMIENRNIIDIRNKIKEIKNKYFKTQDGNKTQVIENPEISTDSNEITTENDKYVKTENRNQTQVTQTPKTIVGNNKTHRTNYKYIKTEGKNQTGEVQERIEIAKSDLMEMKPILCNKNLSLESRTRMVKYYVSSTLFHGIENKTLTRGDMKELKAFEEWVCTRVLNITWTERIRNVEIFDRLGEGLEITKTVTTREIRCQGYIYVRKGAKYFSVDIAMNDKLQGRVKIAGKKKTFWQRKLREKFGCVCVELFMEDEKQRKPDTLMITDYNRY